MNEPTRAQLLDHEYDGIREYDNPTPSWWHYLFLASIVFSVFYAMYWELSPAAPTQAEAWASKQTAYFRKVFGAIGQLEPDEPTILRMMDAPDMLAVAQGIYQGNCAACHGRDGGGINGVNLTDDHYKNVTALTDLYRVIAQGANNGAMPAWENRLGKNERVILAAYVATLRGTSPGPARQAEGEIIAPWPKAAESSAGS
jgi:cytochrome c oxidase cbb3-type subunit 3